MLIWNLKNDWLEVRKFNYSNYLINWFDKIQKMLNWSRSFDLDNISEQVGNMNLFVKIIELKKVNLRKTFFTETLSNAKEGRQSNSFPRQTSANRARPVELSTLEVSVCMPAYSFAYWAKWPNLKLKTRPKQLLGYLPLDIAFTSHRLFSLWPGSNPWNTLNCVTFNFERWARAFFIAVKFQSNPIQSNPIQSNPIQSKVVTPYNWSPFERTPPRM
jgi:hypothetical protein